MNRFLLLLSCTFLFQNCSKKQENKLEENQQEITKETDENYSYEVLSFDNGWGYQILSNNKPIIIQKHIPSVQGLRGFENEKDAVKCAELVMFKIKNGGFPPTITPNELDSLNLID